MITIEQQKEGVELMKSLVEKALENASFKDQLISDPVKTLESFTGNKTNENFKFVVEDQTNSAVIYFNIPQKPNIEEMELSDEQLNMVSGGEFVVAGVAIGLVALFGTGVGIGIALSAMHK